MVYFGLRSSNPLTKENSLTGRKADIQNGFLKVSHFVKITFPRDFPPEFS